MPSPALTKKERARIATFSAYNDPGIGQRAVAAVLSELVLAEAVMTEIAESKAKARESVAEP